MNLKRWLSLAMVSGALCVWAGERYAIGAYDPAKLKMGHAGPIFPPRELVKPSGIAPARAEDFAIRPERVAQVRDSLYGSKTEMQQLARYFSSGPGKALALSWQKRAASRVNHWAFYAKQENARHLLNLQEVAPLGIVYLFSGDARLGRFLHDYLMDAAELPLEFWLHTEIWGEWSFQKDKPPLAGLYTGNAAVALAQLLSAADRELFTPQELEHLKKMLKIKLLEPLENYLRREVKGGHNWIANIATGQLYLATYLGETARREYALSRLLAFVTHAVEEDGSYGEGIHYFCYMFSEAAKGWNVLTAADKETFCRHNPLARSTRWMATGHFLNRAPDGSFTAEHIAFSDNSCRLDADVFLFHWMMANYRDGLAAWMWQNRLSCGDRTVNGINGVLRYASLGPIPPVPVQTPAEAKLPLLKIYANGETHLRTSWEPGATVIGLKRSVMTRVGSNHSRPESNNFVMASHHDYLVVGPGTSCYRGWKSKEYDRRTVSANTVMVDGQDQRFPWAKKQVTACRGGETAQYLFVTQDSAPVYPGMKRAERTVVLFKKSGCVAVIDRFEAQDGVHRYDLRWHFCNWDGKSVLTGEKGRFLLRRPRTTLAVQIDGSVPLSFSREKAMMHQSGNQPMPGMPGEGTWGSALALKAEAKPGKEVTFITLFSPAAAGEKPGSITCQNGVITADGISLDCRKINTERLLPYGK